MNIGLFWVLWIQEVILIVTGTAANVYTSLLCVRHSSLYFII